MTRTETVKEVNILNFLLMFSGIQPVFDRFQNGSKYSIFGVISVIVHSGLGVYSDYKLQEEQHIQETTMSNNIIYAMTSLQRFFNYANPVLHLVGAVVQFKSMATFLELEDEINYYLNAFTEDVSKMYKKIRKAQLIAVVVAILISINALISCVMAYCFSFNARLADVQFYTYYTGVFYTLPYVTVNLKIFVNYYALSLRMDLFNGQLEKVLNLDRQSNVALMKESRAPDHESTF